MDIHPQSFRALAYEVLDHLTASGNNDDGKLTLPLIEQHLRKETGELFRAQDYAREGRGEEPESYRLTPLAAKLSGTELRQSVPLPGILVFAGKPYITFVGPSEAEEGFTPVDYRWQLRGMVELQQKPAFCTESNQLIIELNPESVLVEDIVIVCVLSDLFPKEGRADTWYWKQPWVMPEDVKNKVKMQTIRVFMGTHIQLRPLIDKKNNGTEE